MSGNEASESSTDFMCTGSDLSVVRDVFIMSEIYAKSTLSCEDCSDGETESVHCASSRISVERIQERSERSK